LLVTDLVTSLLSRFVAFSRLASLRNRHEPVHSGTIVLRRITHRHLDAAVSHQFGHRATINSRHNQPTCKAMTVAMPGVVLDLRFGQRLIEPAADRARRPETHTPGRRVPSPSLSVGPHGPASPVSDPARPCMQLH